MASLALCGGVARNARLREMAEERGRAQGLCVIPATPDYCTDNGAMVASLAEAMVLAGKAPRDEDLGVQAQSRSLVA